MSINTDVFDSTRQLLDQVSKDGKRNVDLRGHIQFRGKADVKCAERLVNRSLIIINNARTILDTANNNNWVKLILEFGDSCPTCTKPLEFECNGQEIRSTTECEYKDGIPPLELTLNIPSGKMVVANDLRALFPVATEYDINTLLGQYETSLDYSKAGMIHVFVGNSCPGLYRMDKEGKSFELGTGDIAKRSQEELGFVCTDLWWASIVDYDVFMAAGGELDENNDFIVTCIPGTYQFVHDYHHDAETYTKITWNGPATEATNYRASYDKLNYTLEEVLFAFNREWDSYLSSFKGDENSRAQRMLDHIFFTLGNGIDWHPNGWAQATKMPEKVEGAPIGRMDLPVLTKAYSWYPCTAYSRIANLANIQNPAHLFEAEVPRLNPSFWRGLVNCLQNILTYGISKAEFDAQCTAYIVPACLEGLMLDYKELVTAEDQALAAKHSIAGARMRYLKAQEIENHINKQVFTAYPAALKNSLMGINPTGSHARTERTILLYPLGYHHYHKPPDFELKISKKDPAPILKKWDLKETNKGIVVTFDGQDYTIQGAKKELAKYAVATVSMLPGKPAKT